MCRFEWSRSKLHLISLTVKHSGRTFFFETERKKNARKKNSNPFVCMIQLMPQAKWQLWSAWVGEEIRNIGCGCPGVVQRKLNKFFGPERCRPWPRRMSMLCYAFFIWNTFLSLTDTCSGICSTMMWCFNQKFSYRHLPGWPLAKTKSFARLDAFCKGWKKSKIIFD